MDILKQELKGCYDFFDELSNNSGLTRDSSKFNPTVSSIASIGYSLCSLVIGVMNNWLDYNDAYKKALNTLQTIENLEQYEGFYYHFLDMKSGLRVWNCEVSNIDTAIMISGVILAGEFFGKEIKDIADKLYRKINFPWFVDENNHQFHLGFTEEKGFFGHWDFYAEQLMLYVLGAGSPTKPVDLSVYNSFTREFGSYKEHTDIVQSWFGSLFTYQLSHAWLDFNNKVDDDGIDWFENSRKASLANYQYCIDNNHQFPSYSENSWGITASVGESGYQVECGALPAKHKIELHNDGTIAPYGALSSIVFTEKESLKALKYYYSMEKLKGKYGLNGAYKITKEKSWYSEECLGIDKGLTMLMIQNYLDKAIWSLMNKNENIQNGFKKLNFNNKDLTPKK